MPLDDFIEEKVRDLSKAPNIIPKSQLRKALREAHLNALKLVEERMGEGIEDWQGLYTEEEYELKKTILGKNDAVRVVSGEVRGYNISHREIKELLKALRNARCAILPRKESEVKTLGFNSS
jgi:flagellar basal body rod protein FlgF